MNARYIHPTIILRVASKVKYKLSPAFLRRRVFKRAEEAMNVIFPCNMHLLRANKCDLLPNTVQKTL